MARSRTVDSPIDLVADESALGEALHKAVPPDFQLESDNDEIGFIRRKLPGADIYFVANTSNHPVSVRRRPSRPLTSSASAGMLIPGPLLPSFRSGRHTSEPGCLRVSYLCLQRHSLRARRAAGSRGAQIADLSTDWKVTFTSTSKTISEHVLADWTSDPATRFYSGEAVYERDFTLSKVPDGARFS